MPLCCLRVGPGRLQYRIRGELTPSEPRFESDCKKLAMMNNDTLAEAIRIIQSRAALTYYLHLI